MKKVINLVFIILLSFMLTSCYYSPLGEYKASGIKEIEMYANNFKESSLINKDDYEALDIIVLSSKQKINTAKDKNRILEIIVNTKKEIDNMKIIQSIKFPFLDYDHFEMFYNLQQAYDENLLTVEDLERLSQNILLRNYLNLPIELEEELLEEWIMWAIYNDIDIKDYIPEISAYYGIYNNYFIVQIFLSTDPLPISPEIIRPLPISPEIIRPLAVIYKAGGVSFSQSIDSLPILVWARD